jgi:16S rRNA (guanine527-N7)-methyltransferase
VFKTVLVERLHGIVELSADQLARLQAHFELLTRWNRVLNLSSVEGVGEIVERHYCEALFLASHLPAAPLRIVDIGSGAGFPGFPVAVVRPDCEVTLVEAHQRKAVFLREASRDAGNIRVMPVRAETVVERFDLAISRAVSYADLVKPLKRLSDAADLLTGGEAPPVSLAMEWEEVSLPWGKSRYLRYGRRKQV